VENIILPESIKPGATIGIIAPSSSAPRQTTKEGIKYLQSKGYIIKKAPYLTKGKFYLAGPDKIRLNNLIKFILDPEIDALICVRGGYGLLRILDQIPYDKLKQTKPKILVGYSDFTALQMALLKKCGWITYSGPMVASEMGKGISKFSEYWFWKTIDHDNFPITLENPQDQPMQVYKQGKAKGKLIGGCLSLITPLLNTSYMPSLKGAILILEDVGEPTYKIDKLFQILKLHNVFEEISGLILGNFLNCFPQNKNKSFTLQDLLNDFVSQYNFPIITNFAYGHISQRFTLPVGSNIEIDTDPLKITLNGI